LTISFPHGAFYILVDISSQPSPSLEFSGDFLEAEHVAVAPGCAFGELCDRYVRISLCASEEALTEGLGRLARHLQKAVARSESLAMARIA